MELDTLKQLPKHSRNIHMATRTMEAHSALFQQSEKS